MQRFAAVLVLAVAACAPPASGGDGLDVVTTVYPLTWVAGEVLPDAQVTGLSAAGQDPHDMELTPSQRAHLEQADIVAYLGQIGFQPQVESAVGEADGEVVDAMQTVGEDALRHIDDDEHAEDDGGEGSHGEVVDPHLWFEADLMAQVAVAIGEAAAKADAANAAQHRQRAQTVATELEAAADDIADLLASCRHDTVVVSHEAYAYLTEPHGLEQVGISGAGGHGEASPADIARLAQIVREQGLPAVLSEPVEGRTDAEAVAAEAGVEVIEILSLDVVDDTQAQRGLPALLREQAEAVARAAECAS